MPGRPWLSGAPASQVLSGLWQGPWISRRVRGGTRDIHTGDKGPNTHWVHGENIEITVNMWLQYAQWSNAEYILNISYCVTQICPVGTCWVHFECAQPSDSNVPSGQTIGHIFNVRRNAITTCPVGKMLNIFKICLAEKVQCNQRPSIDRIYNVPCHATLLYPNKMSGYIWNNVLNTLQKTTTFKMYPTKWSHLVRTLDIL